jgi:hypothetical protein
MKMTDLSEAHHNWVRETFNVDPLTFTAPDAHAEDRISASNVALCDVSHLVSDFTNEVHQAARHAVDAYIALQALGSTAWRLDDAAGAARVLAQAAPHLSREDRAILELGAEQVDNDNRLLRHYYDDAQAALSAYDAATRELRNLPGHVAAPAAGDAPPAIDGGALEHIVDFINQVTQIMDLASVVHLVAGMDVIKDAIHADDTDRRIEAINTRIEAQRTALNTLISSTQQRAADDARSAAASFDRVLGMVAEQAVAVRRAVAQYMGNLQHLGRRQGQGEGHAHRSQDERKVMLTYHAVIEAYTASRTALGLLNTPTLGRISVQQWIRQLVPLGMPVTGGSYPNGACVFARGSMQTRYSATVQVMEAMASGVELARDLYANAQHIEQLREAWRAAMKSSLAAP